MIRDEVASLMTEIFSQCQEARNAGQAEYAHREDNAFANFDRVAERLHLAREQVLLVYLEKHLDGIHAWVNGHRSQREDVRGRIKDAIVYLCLLWGMANEQEVKHEPNLAVDQQGNQENYKIYPGLTNPDTRTP